jgi:hypothetical protein
MSDDFDIAGDPYIHFLDCLRDQTLPELRLYAAILEDARVCLTQEARVSGKTRAEALAWIDGRVESAPLCSFQEICALFRLDADAVRARLLRHSAAARPTSRAGSPPVIQCAHP